MNVSAKPADGPYQLTSKTIVGFLTATSASTFNALAASKDIIPIPTGAENTVVNASVKSVTELIYIRSGRHSDKGSVFEYHTSGIGIPREDLNTANIYEVSFGVNSYSNGLDKVFIVVDGQDYRTIIKKNNEGGLPIDAVLYEVKEFYHKNPNGNLISVRNTSTNEFMAYSAGPNVWRKLDKYFPSTNVVDTTNIIEEQHPNAKHSRLNMNPK